MESLPANLWWGNLWDTFLYTSAIRALHFSIDSNFDYVVMKCLVSCLTSSPIIYSQILRWNVQMVVFLSWFFSEKMHCMTPMSTSINIEINITELVFLLPLIKHFHSKMGVIRVRSTLVLCVTFYFFHCNVCTRKSTVYTLVTTIVG